MGLNTILYYIIGLFLLYLLGLLLVWPIKKIVKLIFNGILGGIILLIFNFIGKFFGLSIAINPLNAIIVGFLGVPGVILLLVLQVIL
ncbi:MAG: pro-sigmaK processing inhibitor BofA [Tissierellia bacterium]|nr:pro-sigmaK processing inhibitor BofA [Tissierellia bacterium]